MKRRQQTGHGQLLSGLQDGFEEEGVVSARMRLLYDYRAPAGTRWSPTTEQLRELQALFHLGGLRTPTTAQISRITARLRAHGRIEGRNVFYWFQNQKARERKRRLELMAQEEPISSPDAHEPTERTGAPQPMQQPKGPASCRQVACVSSQCDHTTQETDSLSALHLWPCRHQAKLPLAVELAVAQEEAAGGILLQESACAQYELRPRLNFGFGHSPPFLQAEDEQSEVSDAIANAQPSSFRAISTEYKCGAPLQSAAILSAADGAVTQRAVTMGRACPDDTSRANELDEIDSVSTLEMSHGQYRILRSSYDNSRDLNSRFPLVLFPLSPLQREKQAAPPASSCCCSHNQAQHRVSLLGEESLRLSLTSSTQLLDLNLAIDH